MGNYDDLIPKGKDNPYEDLVPKPSKKSYTIGESISSGLSNLPGGFLNLAKTMIDPQTYKNALKSTETLSPYERTPEGYFVRKQEQLPQEQIGAVAEQYGESYGGLENIKRTIAEKPEQLFMDLATALTGTKGILPSTGILGKVGSISRKAGELTNPLSWPGDIGGLVRKGISATGLPKSLFERTMKIPPGSVKQAKRESIIDTMVSKEGLPLGKGTVPKMNQMIKELDDGITGTLNNVVSQTGANLDINVVSNALDSLKQKFSNRPNPQRYYDIIDNVKDDYVNHAYVNKGRLDIAKAHDLKKGTYQEIAEWYKKSDKPETGRVGIQNQPEAIAKDTAARALREAIVNHPDVPEGLKNQLSKEAGLMEARRWVERAVNRGQNIDPIRLSSILFGMLVEHGVPGAIAFQWAGSQPALSRFAIWLKKGSKTIQDIGEIAKPGALATYQTSRIQMEK